MKDSRVDATRRLKHTARRFKRKIDIFSNFHSNTYSNKLDTSLFTALMCNLRGCHCPWWLPSRGCLGGGCLL